MKQLTIMGLAIVSVMTLSWGHTASSATSPPTIVLEKAVHFLTPGGEDVVVEAGTYEVESAEEWLRLIPQGGHRTEAILVEAQVAEHAEGLEEPVAKSEPGGEDQHRIALLLPGGTTLETVGSYSGVRSRGFLSKLQGEIPRTKRAGSVPVRATSCKVKAFDAYKNAKRHGHKFQCFHYVYRNTKPIITPAVVTPLPSGEIMCSGSNTKSGSDLTGFFNKYTVYARYFKRQLGNGWQISSITTDTGVQRREKADLTRWPWQVSCNHALCFRNNRPNDNPKFKIRLRTITLRKVGGNCANAISEAFGPQGSVKASSPVPRTKIFTIPWESLMREAPRKKQCVSIAWRDKYMANKGKGGSSASVQLRGPDSSQDPPKIEVISKRIPFNTRALVTKGVLLTAKWTYTNARIRFYFFNRPLTCNTRDVSRKSPESFRCWDGIQEVQPMPLAKEWTVEDVSLQIPEGFAWDARRPARGDRDLMIILNAGSLGTPKEGRVGRLTGTVKLRGPGNAKQWTEAFRTDAGC